MYCSRKDRRQKCATRAWREFMREMRWDGWHGYLFPVTCGEYVKPTDAIVIEECPFCGGLLPLGTGRLVQLELERKRRQQQQQADGGEGEEC